jgi:hypothetical protein
VLRLLNVYYSKLTGRIQAFSGEGCTLSLALLYQQFVDCQWLIFRSPSIPNRSCKAFRFVLVGIPCLSQW